MKTFLLLLTLALLAMASGVSAANSAVQPGNETRPGLERTEDLSVVAGPVSFSGTWKTIAGEIECTVILKQIGKSVTGSYSPGNGRIFDGVVSGNKLTFKWTQDGGKEGTAEFTMDEDGKGFTGSSSALKPTEYTFRWSTYKAPAASFAGTWETISDGKNSISLTMVQKGDQVTGTYPGPNGKLEGTVTDKVLRFKWKSDRGTGSGRFVMDESAKAFSGSYNRGDNPDKVDAIWNGKRPAVSADKAPEKVTGPPISFTGVWKTMLGTGKEIEVVLQQTGDKVTGTYMPGDAHIKEGVVTGRVLRFKWTRWEDGLTGSGRFEMGADGKSISGSWNPSKDPDAAGTPWYGTLKPLSFTGVWNTWVVLNTPLGTAKEIEVTLRQTGDKVTGTYMPGDGSIKDGVVTGFVLRFQWTQEDGLSGSGRFEIFPHGNSIDGSWNPGSKDPDAAGTSWYGIRQPLSFAGCWKLTGGLMPGETICLKQDSRGHVTDGAQFEGTVVDNTLRFTGAAGSGRFVLDKGGKSFHGFWHPGNDPELNENPCTGISAHKPFPATFAGAWRAKFGEQFLQVVFQQLGAEVTGELIGFSYRVVIREGIVDGNTLHFKLFRLNINPLWHKPDEYMGTGELVMNRSDRSFTGTILGATASGTLIGR